MRQTIKGMILLSTYTVWLAKTFFAIYSGIHYASTGV